MTINPSFTRSLLSLYALLLLTNLNLRAQGSSDLYERLRKLGNVSSVLYIAAHPDDENTRLITWLSKEKLCRTAYVSLTRGDGGQNLIGAELGIGLGLIRTRELMAARSIDGGEQFFTTAYDFGYSKTSDETLHKWNREKVLGDLVYLIRSYKPDLIICRFPPDSRAGHGHHSSSAILGKEAFEAASDPLRFPEHLTKVKVWQARRIYWNTFNFGNNNTTSESQLKLDAGAFNPVSGKSCGELAAESRSMHKSQGFGVPRQRGTQTEYFSPVGGDTLTSDLFKNIPQGWNELPGGKKVDEAIEKAIREFNFRQPEASIPAVMAIRNELQRLPVSDLRDRKLKECESILLDQCGFWTAAYAFRPAYAVGDTIHVNVQAITRTGDTLQLRLFTDGTQDTAALLTLPPQKSVNLRRILPGSVRTSQPFWLREDLKGAGFNVSDPFLAIQPWNEPACIIRAELLLKGNRIPVTIPVTYKHTDPVRGELFDPLFIRPVLTGKFRDELILFGNQTEKRTLLRLEYHAQDSLSVIVRADLNAGKEWGLNLRDTSIIFSGPGASAELPLYISRKTSGTDTATLKFSYSIPAKFTNEPLTGRQLISYDHIPPIEWYPPLHADLRHADIRHETKVVYYIRGAGDEVPVVLRQLGIEVLEMNAEELDEKDLSVADAIITGIRAYNTDDYLPRVWEKIEGYIKAGGTFVVQYNTNSNLHPSRYMAPYPYSISRNRVTEEDSPVSFVEPAHPLLQRPNVITEADFGHWIQERGLYFATKADSAYQQILLMNDNGEKPQEGSLIYCRYGKGRYIYTGLSFFRQLPAGNTGALRLFCNLIAREEPRLNGMQKR